jgi:hypothetical protein
MSGKTKVIASSDIASGQQPVVTKRGGVGFGPGAVIQAVPASDTATTIQITNAIPETTPAVESQVQATTLEEPAAPTESAQIDMSIVNNALEALQKAEAVKAKAVEDAIAATKLEMQVQIDQAKADAETLIEQANAEKETAAKQIADANKVQQSITELGKLVNKPIEVPMVNTVTSTDSSPKGLADEFLSIMHSSNVQTHTSSELGVIKQRNGEDITNFIRRSKSGGFYSQMLSDIEDWGRREFGLFTNAPGATTGAVGSMPEAFLDVLSQLVRETHNQRNVWWQFVTTVYDASGAPSKSILLPRYNNLAQPTSLNDYLLGDYTSFTPMPNATGATADSQGIEMTTVPVVIKEYGLGKSGGSAATRPVYIPNFHKRYSLVQSISDVVNSKLGQNYFAVEDLMCRLPFAQTTKVLYNKRNSVITGAITQINAVGDIGRITKNFLTALFGHMDAQQVPAFPDGAYILVLPSQCAVALEQDLGTDFRPVTKQQQEATTASLIAATPGVEIGHVNGFFGTYGGFNIFTTNSAGVGAPGSEGVATETLGGALGAATVRDCYAFGPGAVGRGVGMPMEIRPSGVNAYNRGESYIWLSHENTSTVDTDSAIVLPANQQTRVFKVRALDAPV